MSQSLSMHKQGLCNVRCAASVAMLAELVNDLKSSLLQIAACSLTCKNNPDANSEQAQLQWCQSRKPHKRGSAAI